MIFAPVAQWIEQRSSKPKVAGSNPVRGTYYILGRSNTIQKITNDHED